VAENLGQGYVEVVPDFSTFDRQLRDGIQRALDEIAATAEGVGESVERAFEEAARGAEESLGDIGGASLDGIGEQAQREGEQVERAFNEAARESERSLGRISGAIGLIGGAIAAAGIGAGIGFAIDQASDLGESINAVNVTFEENAAGISALAEQANTSLGLTEAQFNSLSVQFSSFANTLAGDSGDVVGVIDEMTTRAADFASVMNLEVADAAALFQSGLAGETEPLKKFGLDLSAAAVEAFALENGIADSAASMTDAQKVQARYGLLMEQTAKTTGDFANTSDSLANGLRILKATATEAAASFGTALLPGLQGVVGAANEMASGLTAPLQDLGAVVGDALVPLFDQLGPAITTIVEGVVPVIANLGQVIGDLAPLLTPVAEVLATIGAVVSGALMRAFDALAPAIEVVAGFLSDIADVVGDTLLEVFDALQPALDAVGELFRTVLATVLPIIVNLVRQLAPILGVIADVFSEVLAQVLPIIGESFARIAEALEPVVPLLGDALLSAVEALTPLIPVLVEHFAEMSVIFADLLVAILPILEPLLRLVTILLDEAIAPAITVIAEALAVFSGVLREVVEVVAWFVETIIGWFTDLFNILVGNSIIPDLVNAIFEWFTAIPRLIVEALGTMVADVAGIFVDLAAEALGPVTGLVDDIFTAFAELPGLILGLLGDVLDAGGDLGGALIDGFIDGLTGIVGLAGDLVSALGGVFADVWNTFIDTINAGVPDKISLPGPVPDIQLPDDPFSFLKLAEGALIPATPGGVNVMLSNGLPATIGEGRHDEAVLPLPDGLVEGLQAIANGRGVGGNHEWHLYGSDPRVLARRIGDEMRTIELLGGNPDDDLGLVAA
jgi:phage-related protein